MTTQAEMARYLYMAWKDKMDVLDPSPEMVFMNIDDARTEAPTGRTKPRLRWDALDSRQRNVWLEVASVALRVGAVA